MSKKNKDIYVEKNKDIFAPKKKSKEILGQRIFPVGMMGKVLAHIRHIE